MITRANNQDSIEKSLAQTPLPNLHRVYFDLPRWMRFWKQGARGVYAYYYLWQLGAYFVAKKLHREIGFDLVHHVTFVNYWKPSFLALLSVPFIWGPVGGGESAPRAFWGAFSSRGKFYELLRHLARRAGEFDPFVRITARRAASTFATTEDTARRIRALGGRSISLYSEAGLTPAEITSLRAYPQRLEDPFRLLSVGNLLHLKGFDLGIRAFGEFHRRFPSSEYWVIGDGPERRRLEDLARELRIDKSVTFLGRIERPQVLEKLAECDVLVHPSLHDSGGWVCLEAMAARRPVICLDLGGPGFQVTEETGFKIQAVSPAVGIRGLADAMLRLARDSTLRRRLGEAGHQRVVAHFDWDQKGTFMANTYEALKEGAPGESACVSVTSSSNLQFSAGRSLSGGKDEAIR